MSQGWKKAFERLFWKNRPSTDTPLNASDMNHIESGIDALDDRIVQLDVLKADAQAVNGMVADISVNDADGVITVTYKNGSTKTYDTNLEKIATNFTYDYSTQRLVLTLSDGSKQYVDMSALVTQYEFEDSTTIAFSVDLTGKVSASVKDGSITDEMLETQYLAQIKTESAKAQSASEQAQSSETASDYNAKLSQSYAIGGSGIRDGENTDNSKYYCAQAKTISESLAKGYVTGVKGNEEKIYRRGDVNLTCDNIGALAIDGDSQDVTTTFTSNDSLNELDSTPPELVVSGESHKSLFSKISTAIKNVRWLLSKIGTTDISSIGDGSITSALSELNANKQDASTAITTSNISTQSVNSAKTANIATNATTANTLKAGGTDTAMTFNYKAATTNPTYLWGTHLGVANQYVYTPTTVVTAGNGVRSTDGTYYKVTAIQTFKDTDNALITGSKGNYIFGISSFSDKRLKTNIQDSKVSGLDIINSIHMHSFDFTDDKYGKSKDIGYVAQELKEIVPECVVNVPQDKDEFGFDSLYQVNDTPLIKYLVKAVQELTEELKELKNCK
nr:MAG TPA: tail protein [Bacteriophage sp.]